MKRVVAAVLLGLVLMGAAGAWAAEIQGKIQSVDRLDRVIVLEDGTRLWLAEGLSMETLREGASVKAAFEEREGKNVITSFEVSE